MPGEQLLFINPRRRKRAKNARKVHRRRVHRNARRRARRRNPMVMFKPRRHRAHRRHLMRNVRRRRVHRNPFSVKGITAQVFPAAIGAVGALGLDVAYGYLGGMLPETVTSNPWLTAAVKIAGAFGLGWVATKAMGREKGHAVTLGAVTVVSYGVLKSLLKQAAPTLPGLAGFDAYMPHMAGFGAYNPSPYIRSAVPGLTATVREATLPNLGAMSAYMPTAAQMAGIYSDEMF